MITKIKNKIESLKGKYYTIEDLNRLKKFKESGGVLIYDPYKRGFSILGLGVIGIFIPLIPALVFIPLGIYTIIKAYSYEKKLKGGKK